jgi:hypothetical protein
VQIVGEGIFLSRQSLPASEGARKLLSEEQELAIWKTLIARCVLYRVSPDFDPPTGQSGVALYAYGRREDDTDGLGVVGFQSFVQRSGHVQSYEMEGTALEQRLRLGRVAFYGAFQVPDEMRTQHVIM